MPEKLPRFGFAVLRILDCGFMIEESISPDEDKIELGYGMNFSFSIEKNWVEFVVKAAYQHSDLKQIMVSGTVLTKFHVNDLAGFVDKKEKITFPDGSLETLFGIAFGHLRAILSKNISGSKFSHFMLPAINPNLLFKSLLNDLVAHNKITSDETGNIELV